MHHAPQKYRNNKGTGGGGERETEWAKTSKEQGELGAQWAAAQRTKFQHLGTKCGRYVGRMVRTGKGGEEGWGWDNLREGSHGSPQSQEEILIPI